MNRLLFLGLLFVGTGCNSPYLADDVDFDFDFFEIQVSDDLHTPYVAGGEVNISVRRGDDDDGTHAGWTLASSNESVLRIEEQADGSARCKAVAPGFATVSAFDETGEHIEDGEVEVRKPTHLELWPHGWQIIDDPRREVRPAVLAGGTATFHVRYFDGDQELFGSNALTVEADLDVSTKAVQTLFFERREWLQITPSTAGTRSVRLFVGGEQLSETTIDVVTPPDVQTVTLIHEADYEAEDEHLVTVLAQPWLGDGRPVYGAEFSWDLDGDGQEGLGDLFRYYYEEDRERVLGSEFDGIRTETIIQASRGYVDSTNNVGCSVAPRGARWGWLVGLAMAFIHLQRSRSTNRRRPAR